MFYIWDKGISYVLAAYEIYEDIGLVSIQID